MVVSTLISVQSMAWAMSLCEVRWGEVIVDHYYSDSQFFYNLLVNISGPACLARVPRCVLATCILTSHVCTCTHWDWWDPSLPTLPRPVFAQNWDPPITGVALSATRGQKTPDIWGQADCGNLDLADIKYLLASQPRLPFILWGNCPRRLLGRLAVPGLTWSGGLVEPWRPAWRHRNHLRL